MRNWLSRYLVLSNNPISFSPLSIALLVLSVAVTTHGCSPISSSIDKLMTESGSSPAMVLPADQSEAEPEFKTHDHTPTGSEKLLIVDDEPAVVKLVHHMLARLGYSITSVSAIREALELMENTAVSIALPPNNRSWCVKRIFVVNG